ETVTDYDRRRIARLVQVQAEYSAALRLDAEHGKIIGGDELPEDALRLGVSGALKGDVEGDADLKRGNAGEEVLSFAKLLDVVVRDGLFGHDQLFGICGGREIAEEDRPFRAVDV